MRAVVLLAASLGLPCAGCAARPAPPPRVSVVPTSAPAATRAASRRDLACAAPTAPVTPTFSTLPTGPLPEGEVISGIEVRGARSVPAALVLSEMTVHPGDRFESEKVDASLVAVEALRAFEDVRITWERRPRAPGVALTVEVDERPLIGEIFVAPGAAPPPAGGWVPPLPGELYEPAMVARALHALKRYWMAEGHLDTAVAAHARRVDPGHVDLCLALDQGPRWTLESLDFPGSTVVPPSALRAEVYTHDDRVNVPGKPYRADLLETDLLRISALLYDHGLIQHSLGSPRVTRLPEQHALRVEIPVDEGPVFRIGRVSFAGRLAGPREKYEALVVPRPGEVFSRARLLESIERVRARHHALTGKSIAVEPGSELDVARGTIDLVLRVKEGG